MVKMLSELYLEARKALMQQEDPQTAGVMARELICHITGKTQEQFLTDRQKYVGDEQCVQMEQYVGRLLAGEPIAYVLGEWDFYGMRLYVNEHVLIPRDDTCAVTELAIKKALFLGEDPRILDICTGTGCIGLAVANRVKDARVTLADISQEALAVAKKNIQKQKLNARVCAVTADALQKPPAFLGKFDLIVSNPPYITTDEMQQLPESVKDYEPHIALHGGFDGLDFYRSIIENYTSSLKPNGYLCFEFGMGQGDDICELLEKNGYTILERTRDYNDRERAVIAQYLGKEDYLWQ